MKTRVKWQEKVMFIVQKEGICIVYRGNGGEVGCGWRR